MNGNRRRLARRIHAWLGVCASLNILLLVATGLLLENREPLRLEDRYVSRRYLPSSYRVNDGDEVRSDIVITDIHSGRILGRSGLLIQDAITIGWFLLLGTGVIIFIKRYSRGGANGDRLE